MGFVDREQSVVVLGTKEELEDQESYMHLMRLNQGCQEHLHCLACMIASVNDVVTHSRA